MVHGELVPERQDLELEGTPGPATVHQGVDQQAQEVSHPGTVPAELTRVSQWLILLLVNVEWDEAKNQANLRKHGVSFEEARVLFTSGVDYLEIFDETHSEDEDRFIAIGPIRRGLVLIVWTERDESVTRIISDRWATSRERGWYQAYMVERE